VTCVRTVCDRLTVPTWLACREVRCGDAAADTIVGDDIAATNALTGLGDAGIDASSLDEMRFAADGDDGAVAVGDDNTATTAARGGAYELARCASRRAAVGAAGAATDPVDMARAATPTAGVLGIGVGGGASLSSSSTVALAYASLSRLVRNCVDDCAARL
jgi:hypothetical protein